MNANNLRTIQYTIITRLLLPLDYSTQSARLQNRWMGWWWWWWEAVGQGEEVEEGAFDTSWEQLNIEMRLSVFLSCFHSLEWILFDVVSVSHSLCPYRCVGMCVGVQLRIGWDLNLHDNLLWGTPLSYSSISSCIYPASRAPTHFIHHMEQSNIFKQTPPAGRFAFVYSVVGTTISDNNNNNIL